MSEREVFTPTTATELFRETVASNLELVNMDTPYLNGLRDIFDAMSLLEDRPDEDVLDEVVVKTVDENLKDGVKRRRSASQLRRSLANESERTEILRIINEGGTNEEIAQLASGLLALAFADSGEMGIINLFGESDEAILADAEFQIESQADARRLLQQQIDDLKARLEGRDSSEEVDAITDYARYLEAQTSGGEKGDFLSLQDPSVELGTLQEIAFKVYDQLAGLRFKGEPGSLEWNERVEILKESVIWFINSQDMRKYLRNLLTDATSGFEVAMYVEKMISGFQKVHEFMQAIENLHSGNSREIIGLMEKVPDGIEFDALLNIMDVDIRVLMKDGREVTVNYSARGMIDFFLGNEIKEPENVTKLERDEAYKFLEQYQDLFISEYNLDLKQTKRIYHKYLRNKFFRSDLPNSAFNENRLPNHRKVLTPFSEELTNNEEQFVREVLLQDLWVSSSEDYLMEHNDKHVLIEKGKPLLLRYIKPEDERRLNNDVDVWPLFKAGADPRRVGGKIPGVTLMTDKVFNVEEHGSALYIDHLLEEHNIDSRDILTIELPRYSFGAERQMIVKKQGRYGEVVIERGLLSSGDVARLGEGHFAPVYEVYYDVGPRLADAEGKYLQVQTFGESTLPLQDSAGNLIRLARLDNDGNPMYEPEYQVLKKLPEGTQKAVERAFAENLDYLNVDIVEESDQGQVSVRYTLLRYGNEYKIYRGEIDHTLVAKDTNGDDVDIAMFGNYQEYGKFSQVVGKKGKQTRIIYQSVVTNDAGEIQYQVRKDKNGRVITDNAGSVLYRPRVGRDGKEMYQQMIDEDGNPVYENSADILIKNILAVRLPMYQVAQAVMYAYTLTNEFDSANRGENVKKGMLKAVNWREYLKDYTVVSQYPVQLFETAFSDLSYRKKSKDALYQSATGKVKGRVMRNLNPLYIEPDSKYPLQPVMYSKKEHSRLAEVRATLNEVIASDDRQLKPDQIKIIDDNIRKGVWLQIGPDESTQYIWGARQFQETFLLDHIEANRRLASDNFSIHRDLTHVHLLSRQIWRRQADILLGTDSEYSRKRIAAIESLKNEGRDIDLLNQNPEMGNPQMIEKQILEADLDERIIELYKRDFITATGQAGLIETPDDQLNPEQRSEKQKLLRHVTQKLETTFAPVISIVNATVKKETQRLKYARLYEREKKSVAGRFLNVTQALKKVANWTPKEADAMFPVNYAQSLKSLGYDVDAMPKIAQKGRIGTYYFLKKRSINGVDLANIREASEDHIDYLSREAAIQQELLFPLVVMLNQAIDSQQRELFGIDEHPWKDFGDLFGKVYRANQQRTRMSSATASEYFKSHFETFTEMHKKLGWLDQDKARKEIVSKIFVALGIAMPHKRSLALVLKDPSGNIIPLYIDPQATEKTINAGVAGDARVEIPFKVNRQGFGVGPDYISSDNLEGSGVGFIYCPVETDAYVTSPALEPADQIWGSIDDDGEFVLPPATMARILQGTGHRSPDLHYAPDTEETTHYELAVLYSQAMMDAMAMTQEEREQLLYLMAPNEYQKHK